MASSQVILKISDQSQEWLLEYSRGLRDRFSSQYNIRDQMELVDREYYRENNFGAEHLRAMYSNNMGDMSRFQDITVPLMADHVESWVSFMTEVYCSQVPLFPVVAASKYLEAAIMMNTILDNQARRGGWKAELIKFFRDCAKYSIGACEVSWHKVNTAVLETDLDFSATEARPKNLIWEGNRIKRLDLYNTFWDTTLPATELSQFGEFVGNHELVSKSKLKQIVAGLGDEAIIKNIGKAFESATPDSYYHIPDINHRALLNSEHQRGQDWFAWAGMSKGSDGINYKGKYLVTKLHARILPSDFDIKAPAPNTPQVWTFLIVNMQHIIYAERQTNAHERIPVLFANPKDDGISYQTKSLATDIQPYQQAASTLMNSVMASRRRAISDKGLYNPLYIDEKQINSPNPAAKMPIKPAAYAGVALKDIYMPIPFSDDQAGIAMQEIASISQMAENSFGQNKAQRGQFVRGNKTSNEFNTVMSNADSKPKMQAVVMEDQFFNPLKYILGINILQFQGAEELYDAKDDQVVKIDPLLIRKSIWQFKISDGAVPASQEMSEDAWQVALQIIGSNQQIQANYNLGKMFSYLMQIKGADVSQFEKSDQQQQYEQAVAAWQQAVMGIAEANPDITPEQFPPQPTPEQFGIGPDGKPLPGSEEESRQSQLDSESLIDKLLKAELQQQ